MSEDLDLLIQKKEKELNPLRTRMEELRLQFINETAQFAAKWFDEITRLYVTKRSDVTLSMSKEKLAEMKNRVNDLVKNADRIVRTALSDPNIWWHQAPRKNDSVFQYEQVGSRFPELIDKPIRRALGGLGVVLEQYGYGVTVGSAPRESYQEYWYERTEDYAAGPHPYFPHLLLWSGDMQHTMTQYDELFKQAMKVLLEIQKLKEEKKSRQAGELWNAT